MRTIWKFPLLMIDRQTLSMPIGARILTVQTQNGTPCLWAVVDPNAEKQDVEIRVHGTGHELPPDSNRYGYIGTYQLREGALVFHVFRMKSTIETLGEMFG